jgi:tetratricopeptide (TPR) repeat protein
MLAFLGPVILWTPTGTAFAADRFMTVPAIGLALAAAIGSQALLAWRDGRFSLPLKMGAAITLALLGMMSAIRGEVWKDGTTLWKDVVDRFPRYAEGYNQLGSAVLEERGDIAQAERLFTQAVTLDPRSQTAFVNRALTRARLDRTKDALDDLSEALRLNPMDSPARMARAAILRDSGRLEEALHDVTEALALEPTHIPWRVERVLLLLELGRSGEAAVEVAALERSGVDVQLVMEPRSRVSRRE